MSSYTYHGTQDLIALPGRSIQTFPSGLVRVDRTYACRKGLEAFYREQLRAGNPLPLDDGTPAIDGLFIFPEAQETVRDDGFSEFRVSAYGRINTTGVEQISEEITQQSFTFPEGIFVRGDTFFLESPTISAVVKSEILTKEVVLLEGETVESTTNKIASSPEIIYDGGLNLAPFIFRGIAYRVAIRNYTARNFGRLSEVTVVYAPFIIAQSSS